MPEITKISISRPDDVEPDDITPLDIRPDARRDVRRDAKRDHIRLVNPAQDMPAVLDLIERGFKDELDPQGWKMLRQMRRIYRPGPLAYLLPSPPLNTSGLVWVEDGGIVGNLSLRQAMPRSTQGRMIGNVVVHPDYRGQGIGRALMEEAVDIARRSQARWIGLEVRADNTVACALYRRLGFHAVGLVQHMLRPSSPDWPDSPHPQRTWRASKPEDSVQWAQLAHLVYGYDQRRVLEIRTGAYRFGGLDRWINNCLNLRREKAWITTDAAGEARLAAHVETERRFQFHVWDLLIHPAEGDRGAQEVVAKSLAGIRHIPPWPVVAIIPDLPPLVKAMRRADFTIHRTLQQMILEL